MRNVIRAYQNAVAYAKDRIQMRALSGPKNPDKPADSIIVHPDVRRNLMTMRAFNEAARALVMWTALKGDVALLKQAMMMDPLAGAVCDPEEISQMTDEMLVAQAKWLPQYAAEIPAAQARLEKAVRTGKRVKLVETQGVARLHTKTVAEMEADAEAAMKKMATARSFAS